MENRYKQPHCEPPANVPFPAMDAGKHSHAAAGSMKLLMITDFSDKARCAETRAAMLSMEFGYQPLEVMAIMNADSASTAPSSEAADEEKGAEPAPLVDVEAGLRDIAARLKRWDKLLYVCSVWFGNPIRGILGRVSQLGSCLVIVGKYRGSISANLFRGYSTTDVVRAVNQPVLIVKSPPSDTYQRVIVAVDFSPASQHAALMASRLAPHARLDFVHVIDELAFKYADGTEETGTVTLTRRISAVRAASSRLARFMSEFGAGARNGNKVIRFGFPWSVIHAYAKEINADLIVCGKQSGAWKTGSGIGSVAMGALVQSPCDLLVAAPSPDDDPALRRQAA